MWFRGKPKQPESANYQRAPWEPPLTGWKAEVAGVPPATVDEIEAYERQQAEAAASRREAAEVMARLIEEAKDRWRQERRCYVCDAPPVKFRTYRDERGYTVVQPEGLFYCHGSPDAEVGPIERELRRSRGEKLDEHYACEEHIFKGKCKTCWGK